MVLTKDSEIDGFIDKSKYTSIIGDLIDNLPNLEVTSEFIIIRKKDLIFRLGPKETPIFMKYLFQINNFICNEYRKRIKILNTTQRLDDE